MIKNKETNIKAALPAIAKRTDTKAYHEILDAPMKRAALVPSGHTVDFELTCAQLSKVLGGSWAGVGE